MRESDPKSSFSNRRSNKRDGCHFDQKLKRALNNRDGWNFRHRNSTVTSRLLGSREYRFNIVTVHSKMKVGQIFV